MTARSFGRPCSVQRVAVSPALCCLTAGGHPLSPVFLSGKQSNSDAYFLGITEIISVKHNAVFTKCLKHCCCCSPSHLILLIVAIPFAASSRQALSVQAKSRELEDHCNRI